jgi:superfamily II RNA helicase
LAGTIAALITETPRPDSWTKYPPSKEVFEALGLAKRDDQEVSATVSLWETRRKLNQVQSRYKLAIPVWLESKFIGLVEQWTLGQEWNKVCENTSLDEGDLVRIFRRTVDVLWQIPQIPGIGGELRENAKKAIVAMKRFPVSVDEFP